MKIHRFFIGSQVHADKISIEDASLVHQWRSVLRFSIGRVIRLFNDAGEEREYAIISLGKTKAELEATSSKVVPLAADKQLYLCFALLKKDKVNWVLQKATELGVSHFVPLISDRTEKTGFNMERAQKIVVEAAEQCGRIDVPKVYQPTAMDRLAESLPAELKVYIAEEAGGPFSHVSEDKFAVCVGPEGGWSDAEKQLFVEKGMGRLGLSRFTLRAETACIAAAAKLL